MFLRLMIETLTLSIGKKKLDIKTPTSEKKLKKKHNRIRCEILN